MKQSLFTLVLAVVVAVTVIFRPPVALAAWHSSLWVDSGGSIVTFVSVSNLGTAPENVTVDFLSSGGASIHQENFMLEPRAIRALASGSGGGSPATVGQIGTLTISGSSGVDS